MLNWEILNIISKCFQYIALIPTYINVFLIYSICNVHDCTWGNRPDQLSNEEKNRRQEFKRFRAKWVIVWILCNSGFSYLLTLEKNSGSTNSYYYLLIISTIGMAILILRIFGGLAYWVIEK